MAVGALCSLESLKVSRILCDSRVGDLIGKGFELRGGGYEVSLAAEAYDDGLVSVDPHDNRTFGGGPVSPLGSYELTFLTDDVDSFLEVSFSLDEGVLAVHHSCAGHLAQFHYI